MPENTFIENANNVYFEPVPDEDGLNLNLEADLKTNLAGFFQFIFFFLIFYIFVVSYPSVFNFYEYCRGLACYLFGVFDWFRKCI